MIKTRPVHSYTDFSQVESNTRPGLAYSVAELLRRVQRGEPLPLMKGNFGEGEDIADRDLDGAMDSFERHPLHDASSDEIEAWNFIKDVDERRDASRRRVSGLKIPPKPKDDKLPSQKPNPAKSA